MREVRPASRAGTPTDEAKAPPKITIASVGNPESTATWSGVTAGIVGGLRELGVCTQSLDLTLPGGVERAMLLAAASRTRNRYDAEAAALTARARSTLARRALKRSPVDGVIQIGTTFTLPQETRYVTLEDMTLRQASSGHPVFSRMSAPAVAGWEKRREQIYGHARMCAAASRWTGASLRGDYGVGPSRVAVVGFGANHRMSVPDRDWSSPRFLFVGIDWERKGGPLVLRAFSRLRREIPAATLDIVGGHPPLEQSGVKAHGVLSQSVERDRERIAALFAHATCFVMPSLIEPFGIAYVEAGSCGLPSIGGSIGGPPDVIGADGGLVVEPSDEGGLFEAMLRLADPDTAERMGRVARERSTLYTWPKVAERLLRALGLDSADGRKLAAFL
ncbi:MAG: glycosyl transferase group 1 [Solirubrobacterales bacterium]|nr:glycosyl transferase group 1 [Solirubrobacterales bacterium]